MLTPGGASWVRFSLLGLLEMLDRRYGDLGYLAEHYWRNEVQPNLRAKIMMSAISGTNYTETDAFSDRSVLAIQLFFDGLSTVQNALGHAAITTRKYYVFSVRVANVAVMARDSDCILPLCIVPPEAWDELDFDGVIREIEPEFVQLSEGAFNYYIYMCILYRAAVNCYVNSCYIIAAHAVPVPVAACCCPCCCPCI